MQNAHERFGTLEFIKRTKDTTTRVRVHIDRAVLETPKDERGQASAHLLSMIGGDSEIGALWAAVTEGALFQIQLPDQLNITASLGPEAQCFRGSVMVQGKKRPVRHLVVVSAELAKTKPGTDREGARTILCDDDRVFVLYRLAYRYGLPVVPLPGHEVRKCSESVRRSFTVKNVEMRETKPCRMPIRHLRILWDAKTRIIGIEWKETTAAMTCEEFKTDLMLFASHVEMKKARGILVDVAKFRHRMEPQVQEWRVKNISTRYSAAGLKRFAFLFPLGAQIPPMMNQSSPEEAFQTHAFDNIQQAEAWLGQGT